MFVGRSRDTIRDQILAFWSAQYAALTPPLRLLIAPGSDAYILAASLAVQLEGLEAQAEQTARDILPTEASPEALARHAYVDGVPRLPGTVARHSVTVTNASDGTKTIPLGTVMVYSDGTRYDVASASVVISGGTGTITVVAVSPGAAGTRATGDVLTFNVGVVGIDTTGTVAATPTRVEGTDEESLGDWADRIVSYRQERPGSFNRSHVRALMEAFQGTQIEIAYVYPTCSPPASYPGFSVPETPGTVTVVVVGPAQKDNVINTRLVPVDNGSTRTSGAYLPLIAGYINGTHTITGVPTNDGVQLRPAALPPGNLSIEAIATTQENVTFQAATVGGYPWTGSVAIGSATTSTIVVAGDHTDLNGLDALVLVDSATTVNTRGGYRRYTLPTGVYDGVNTTWTFAASTFPDTPSGSIYPAPAEWEDIRDAAFAYFDTLGPGDTSPAARWPPESQDARSTFYRSALAAAVMNAVPEVISAAVSTPAADVTPPQKTVVVLGRFLVVAL